MYFDQLELDQRSGNQTTRPNRLASFILEHEGIDCRINPDSVTILSPVYHANTDTAHIEEDTVRTLSEAMAVLGY